MWLAQILFLPLKLPVKSLKIKLSFGFLALMRSFIVRIVHDQLLLRVFIVERIGPFLFLRLFELLVIQLQIIL